MRFLNDHERFPDAISIIGAPESGEGLLLGTSTRGVRRTYGVALEDGEVRMRRDAPEIDPAVLRDAFATTLSRAWGDSPKRRASGTMTYG
jgi:hypothetical protein